MIKHLHPAVLLLVVGGKEINEVVTIKLRHIVGFLIKGVFKSSLVSLRDSRDTRCGRLVSLGVRGGEGTGDAGAVFFS
jgi:hypothetical protein